MRRPLQRLLAWFPCRRASIVKFGRRVTPSPEHPLYLARATQTRNRCPSCVAFQFLRRVVSVVDPPLHLRREEPVCCLEAWVDGLVGEHECHAHRVVIAERLDLEGEPRTVGRPGAGGGARPVGLASTDTRVAAKPIGPPNLAERDRRAAFRCSSICVTRSPGDSTSANILVSS